MTDRSKLLALANADARIIDRLDRTGDCWLWTGALDHAGRGRVWHQGKLKLHHRAVWNILVGPIPDGAMLCHHCDNPQCGNPSHLYVGDAASNATDMSRRKRTWAHRDPERAKLLGIAIGKANDWCRGERNPKAKLTPESVAEIRAAKGSSYRIAADYGVNASTVQRIRRGTAWTRAQAEALA